jgi:hypothetical protein
MNIKDLKDELLVWLAKIVYEYRHWLEFQDIDALTDLDNFAQKIGLF